MPTRLTDATIAQELSALDGWHRAGDAIVRTFTFPTFADGIAFVGRVATLADAMDHHPDIDIRYTAVTLALATHSAGGITELDFELARKADEVVSL